MLQFALAALCFVSSGDAFRDLDFEHAQAAAVQEKKIVLIDFFTTWCVPCKKLDAVTWKDEAVLQWIGKEAVALKLDAEKNVELATRFHVDVYPTVLLLKPDGTVIDRLTGYKEPKEFLAAAADALAGRNSLARAKDKLVGHEKDPMLRQRYGDELAHAGKYDDALAEYLWCFDHGSESPGYYGVRLSFLLSRIAHLGTVHPPALNALKDRRDAAEARVRTGEFPRDDLVDALSLNDALQDSESSLKLFEDVKKIRPLPPEHRAEFLQELIEPLHQAKRYGELLELLDDPKAYVSEAIQDFDSMRKRSASRSKEEQESMASADAYMKSKVVDRGTILYEALLATTRKAEADEISGKLIAFETTGKTYAALIDAAARAGAGSAAEALGKAGLSALPEKEQAPVQKALKRAAKAK